MTVILMDPRRPTLVPVDAVEFLGGDVQYTEELPIAVPWSLPGARPVLLTEGAGENPAPVLLSSDPGHPAVAERVAAGERVLGPPAGTPGERILDAVAVMDRLRTAGPWESEQTHESLRRYLLEETYELFDAVHRGDADELCSELGDVLLQVLFHARIAEEAPTNAFSIDDVAHALVRKLGNRVPAVLAGESVSLEEQIAQWDERKSLEKSSRESAMDDVPTGQPALALAQKVLDRARRAGVPGDLTPDGMRFVTVDHDVDAENALRTVVLGYMDDVRAAEGAVRTARAQTGSASADPFSEEEWRAGWPHSDDPPGDHSNSVEPQ